MYGIVVLKSATRWCLHARMLVHAWAFNLGCTLLRRGAVVMKVLYTLRSHGTHRLPNATFEVFLQRDLYNVPLFSTEAVVEII